MTDVDPYADRPKRFVGQLCTFDGPDGRRLFGLILTQEWIGFTARGHLPNYRLKIQGAPGATQDVDLVEQKMQIKAS